MLSWPLILNIVTKVFNSELLSKVEIQENSNREKCLNAYIYNQIYIYLSIHTLMTFRYFTKKTKCEFSINFFSISVICFNVICRSYNYIVVSDFSVASYSLRHFYIVLVYSFVEWGVPGVRGFAPNPCLFKGAVSVGPCTPMWEGSLSALKLSGVFTLSCLMMSLTGRLPWTQMTHDADGLSRSVGSMTSSPLVGKAFDSFPAYSLFQLSGKFWEPSSSEPPSLSPPLCRSHAIFPHEI